MTQVKKIGEDKPTALLEAPAPEKAQDNGPTGEDIALAITKWAKSLVQSKTQSQECIVMALEHTFKHSDAVYLNKMLKVIETEGKDYVRKTPFLRWCKDYAPVKMVEGIILFDKEANVAALKAKLPEAKATLWWRTEPEQVVNPFNSVLLFKALVSTAKKFQNEEKYKPENEASKAQLSKTLKTLEEWAAVAESQEAG